MAEISKPDYRNIWASGGAIVSPSDTKWSTGWTSEVPPFQWENAIQNRQDVMLAHINQHGIPRWDALTEYFAGQSYVLGSDGFVYKAVAASSPATTTQDPTTDASDTYWRIAFADASVNYLTQLTGDTRYLQRANNFSDVSNTATARTNLGAAGLASPTFTGTPLAPTAPLNNSTSQIATTAFLFNQFNLTGQQNLSINGYQRLPGGLIIQWGTVITSTAESAGTLFNYPVAFPNNVFSLIATARGVPGGPETPEFYSVTLSNARLLSVAGGGGSLTSTMNWYAVGN